ncbi:MAG: ABC transporter ATP-binding protein [Candidatus Hydrogenedentota bacterium]|nr:MAG: ABC transporter ATP-binding protein [Candidatus Hydrogenedentota bacterium]
MLAANIAMIVVVITNGVSLVTLQPLIDQVFIAEGPTARVVVPTVNLVFSMKKTTLFLGLVLFFLTSRALYCLGLYCQRFLMMVTGERVLTGLRTDLYDHLLRLPPLFFTARRSGALVSNLTADLGVVQHLASTVTGDLLRRPVEIGFLIGLLVAYNPSLSLFALLVAPVIVGIVNILTKTIRRRAGRMQSSMADLADHLQETVGGIRIIQSFTAEKAAAGRFHSVARRYYEQSVKAYRMMAAATPSTELVTAAAVAGILFYGGQNVIAGRMTTGSFFAFMAILMATYQPVKTLVNALSESSRAAAALERIYRILDERPAVTSPTNGRKASFQKSIVFEKVSFAYPDNPCEPVLQDISLTVQRGRTIAIVGPSGAGKTTLLSLIPRFFDPTSGRITIDNVDLREWDLVSLRRQIGIVTQETFLFNASVEENIALGRPNAAPEEIRRAAEAAHILDVIEAMPEGFRTVVGERGARLSGGEKQRLAIARALLVDPPILLLDEATSSLDSESERKVQAAIDTLIRGRTTLVIAHRLSTVRNADTIFVLQNGRIVESGSHADLLQSGNLYARLYNLQFKE